MKFVRYAVSFLFCSVIICSCLVKSEAKPDYLSETSIPPTDTTCNLACNNRLVAEPVDCNIIVASATGCKLQPVHNFTACTQQRGVCQDGVCIPWNGQCLPDDTNAICFNDSDCDDHNPCTSDDCPEPGCGPCHHGQVEDGTLCSSYQTCRNGICCQ